MTRFSENKIILAGKVFRIMGLGWLAKSCQPSDNIRVTTTHYVRSTDKDNFREIVRYLTETRRVITPADFFKFYNSSNGTGELKGQSLLMTFDDGFHSSYLAAKDILSSFGIKAIFFIPTQILELKSQQDMLQFAANNINRGNIESGLLTEDEYVTMNKAEILDLHRDGHLILPHTHTHCDILDIRNQGDVERELIQPKKILEYLLGEKIESLAFPDGTERVVSSYSYDQIKKHYKYAFPALLGVNHKRTNPYFFYRDCIHAHYSLSYVKDILDGVYDPYYYFKMQRLKSRVANPV